MSIGDFSNPTFSNGDVLNASTMQNITDKLDELDKYGFSKYYIKPSDESVNNTTTFQADNYIDTQLPLKAAKYEIELVAFISGVDAGNFKSKWILSGGASAVSPLRLCVGPTPQAGYLTYQTLVQIGTVSIATSNNYGTDGTYVGCIIEKFIIATTSAESYIQWQWAQDTATVGNTTVKAGSYMKVTEVFEGTPV